MNMRRVRQAGMTMASDMVTGDEYLIQGKKINKEYKELLVLPDEFSSCCSPIPSLQ